MPKIFPLNYSYISYEFHFALETILGEVRIRSVRILIGLGLTWFTRYWFPEDCYGEQRTKYNRLLQLSGSRFSLFLFLTLSRVVPMFGTFHTSWVPVIVICLPEPRALSVETSTNNPALSTPPDIWCQIVARFLISLIIELAISVASIVQVREEGWTSGMRESGSIDKKEE
ncbi:hypothetical protein NMG60_11005534 [Bertholletia excelsa]